jgi:protein SCO1/2
MSMSGRAIVGRSAAMLALLLGVVVTATPASAQYFRRPVSDLDARVLQIDEKAVLGRAIEPGTVLIDEAGRELKWGDLLGKPVILVLSYFTCDGSCSIINQSLAELLKSVQVVKPGADFRIVTLSFDRRDDAASAEKFRNLVSGQAAELPPSSWLFATFKNEADLKAETERIGFKFFWSPQDGIFLHPGAFLFFSPEGKLARVLYQQDISGRDVELGVLDARLGNFRPNEIINYALSLCYSYSYKDGKYVMSIPVFVGLGALGIGLSTLFGSMLAFKFGKRRKTTGKREYAQAA